MPMSRAMSVFLKDTVKSEVKVGVHEDSVLSLLLFIIVLEALPRKFALRSPGRTFIPMTL